MSDNVELVRSICTPWERGEFFSAEWAHPEIEFVLADGPDPGSWRGAAAMGRATVNRVRAWEAYHFEIEDYRALDDERVLALTRRHGRGKTSGVEVGQFGTKGAWLFHVRDGQITRLVGYFDRDRAFADLGLEA
jgi:ketosteroid isomerase-like protein